MASATLPASAPALTRPLSPLAGVLSYLIPGLGQIVQGRVAKGLLFLVCIYGLFFYGQWLSTASAEVNGRTYWVTGVYLPDVPADGSEMPRFLPDRARDLYTRPQFLAQFFVGVAAWPAIAQYFHLRAPDTKAALATAEKEYAAGELDKAREAERAASHPLFGDYQREPSAAALNAVHNAHDKRLELAWVYTVIAGVLNILVIYDAVAGPAFASGDDKTKAS